MHRLFPPPACIPLPSAESASYSLFCKRLLIWQGIEPHPGPPRGRRYRDSEGTNAYVSLWNATGVGSNSDTLVDCGIKWNFDFLLMTEVHDPNSGNFGKISRRAVFDRKVSDLDLRVFQSHARASEGRGRPKGGVLIAVRPHWTNDGCIKALSSPEPLTGYVVGIEVRAKLQIWCAYLPPTDSNDPHNLELRRGLLNHLRSVVDECRAAGKQLIMAGDWNATERDGQRNPPSVRPEVTNTDKTFRNWLESCRVGRFAGDREATYRQKSTEEREGWESRIDEFYTLGESAFARQCISETEANLCPPIVVLSPHPRASDSGRFSDGGRFAIYAVLSAITHLQHTL